MEIKEIADLLKKGSTMVYPTDTVWGLGCDACNDKAVEAIYKLKQRDDSMSMIVLVDSLDMIARYVKQIPSIAMDLVSVDDNPLTVIYPQAVGLSPKVAAADGSIAIRLVKHEFCAKLIRALGRPLVSTSANISGAPAPTSFGQISEEIKSGADIVVSRKYEGKMTGKPSSIIKVGLRGEIEIIRG